MTKNTLQRCAPSADSDRCHPSVTPRADVWETADAAHLTVELPGVTADGLDLQVEQDRLTLSGTPDLGTAEGRTLRTEWRPATFRRTFLLTKDADRAGIEARLQHGLLTVRIPRRPETRPRSIPVTVTAD